MKRFCAITLLALMTIREGAFADSFKAVHDGISFKITGNTVQVSPQKGSVSDNQIFTIEHPTRVVIDLPKATIKKNVTVAVPDHPLLSQVRLGRHSDRTRIVLDSKIESIAYSAKVAHGALVLTLTPQTKESSAVIPEPVVTETPVVETQVVETPKEVIATPLPGVKVIRSKRREERKAREHLKKSDSTVPTPEEVKREAVTPEPPAPEQPLTPPVASIPSSDMNAETATPTPAIDAEPVTTPPESETPERVEATPSKTPSPTVTAIRTPHSTPANVSIPLKAPVVKPGQTIYKSLNFNYHGPNREPVIVLSVSAKVEYKMTRRDNGSYLLTLANTAPKSESALLEQFPPHDFLGFTMVQVNQVGNNTEVVVHVDPGVKISAFTKDSEIWIKSLTR